MKAIIVSILSLSFLICGCKINGTGTGNPLHADVPYDPNTSIDGTQAGSIKTSVCESIYDCRPSFDRADCQREIGSLTSFSEKLGVELLPALTLDEIAYAEASDFLTPDVDAAEVCETKLFEVSCDSTTMQDAFDPNLENPFFYSADLLSEDCKLVF